MERNAWFYRFSFIFISCIVGIVYQLSIPGAENVFSSIANGIFKGFSIFALAMVLELGMKNTSLRALNTLVLGIASGTLLGYVITLTVKNAITAIGIDPTSNIVNVANLTIYLASIYFGIMAVSSSQENWWLSIPFVRLTPASQSKKKEIIVDVQALEDARFMELARSGILDHQLVIPTFLAKEIQKGLDAQDEMTRSRMRKCNEHLKRLETMSNLGLVQKEFHFSEQDDLTSRFIRAARILQGYIITTDPALYRQEEEGLCIISIENIANSLKPGAQRGELLAIKIQRLGKEPKQGVGYLEDGTMVVVNGGGEFLGQTVRTQVLSQKYSSSGKIIFCNAITSDDKNGTARPQGIDISSPYHQFSFTNTNS